MEVEDNGDEQEQAPLVEAVEDVGSEEEVESSDDGEEQQFDITLAATHSYMGSSLVSVGGRVVLEAGWRGRVPALASHGAVFPGETVPLLLPHAPDAELLQETVRKDKLFGLLCPDESRLYASGYGVVCEIFEAGVSEPTGEFTRPAPSFKARAIHRFRMVDARRDEPIQLYARVRMVNIRVLPELAAGDPLVHARLLSLDPHRRGGSVLARRLRGMDCAVTAWPLHVYEQFDVVRMRRTLQEYFNTLSLGTHSETNTLPEDPVSLSFWVASNLALSPSDRLALFTLDSALLRLHMEMLLISKKTVLCCSSCLTEIAQCENIFAMSSEGVHSNYTNLGGYMHDIVTVSAATNVQLSGVASEEFSWFPGYAWNIAVCGCCSVHVGWRFDATKRNLRPQQFFGICRNYVQPRVERDAATPPLPPADAPSPLALEHYELRVADDM